MTGINRNTGTHGKANERQPRDPAFFRQPPCFFGALAPEFLPDLQIRLKHGLRNGFGVRFVHVTKRREFELPLILARMVDEDGNRRLRVHVHRTG